MRRRCFLLAAAASLAIVPGVAAAQSDPRIHRLGFLGSTPPSAEPGLWSGFYQGMRELGYEEGRDFVIEGRWYADHPERLPALAAELVDKKVDLIIAGGPPAPEAAQGATSTIPIIMTYHGDPIAAGLSANFARPGGNTTGLSVNAVDTVGKQLELLREAKPAIARVAWLSDPAVALNALALERAEAGARSLGVQLHVVTVEASDDLPRAFAAMVEARDDAVIIRGSSRFFAARGQLAALALEHRLPSIALWKQYPAAGGLMSHGADLRESFRRAATYVDKILKGAKPGDLPIEQASKYELVVNLRTAKTLGVAMPHSILARADEMID